MDVVLMEVEDRVAILTLNRPDRLNAWTPEMEARYFELLEECAADPDVRAIVVTGAGKGFCAGADMGSLQQIGEAGGIGEHRPRAQRFATTIPKPIVAAINGACAGIGLVHALYCDVRFAASDAKFTTAFARRGLVAEHGMSWTLPRLVGHARALDLLMSGRVFLGDEAAQLGVVNAAFAGNEVLDKTLAYASDLAENCSPAAMAAMKRQVNADWTRELPDAIETANALMVESLGADDFREGVASFMEKRPPRFAPVGGEVHAA
ncbi:MAG: enoyl-CoA hydratase [Thermoleophilaceae bacterium]